MLSFEIAGDDEQAAERVDATLAATAAVQRAHPDLRVEQVGSASAMQAFDQAMGEDFKRAEALPIPLTLIILLLAFGTLVAAGLPLLLGLTAVGATLGLLGPISQLTPVTDEIASVILRTSSGDRRRRRDAYVVCCGPLRLPGHRQRR